MPDTPRQPGDAGGPGDGARDEARAGLDWPPGRNGDEARPEKPRKPSRRERREARRRRKQAREGRLARHVRHARTVWEDPRSAGGLLRDGLLGLWSSRGGGFYGLGYVVTFVILEITTIFGEFEGSSGVLAFIGNELLEYLLRLGMMSFVNALLAFLWPLFVLEKLGPWGFVVLLGGYLAFLRWLRPAVEKAFPELRRARRQAAEEAQATDYRE